MPLTFPAHQLLVLPFLGGRAARLPGGALLLGTVLPDLAFVVGGYPLNAQSHLAGGPLLMAPLGLLLYTWAVGLFLPALARALPGEAGRWPLARLCVTRGLPRSARDAAWVLLALLVGAYSHLLFDGFTHSWMWPASALYRYDWLEIGSLSLPAARWLQVVGSVLASLVVVVWTYRFMHRAPACAQAYPWQRGLAAFGLGTLAGAALGFAGGAATFGWPAGSRGMVFLVMSPVALGAFAGASVVAWRLYGREAARRPALH